MRRKLEIFFFCFLKEFISCESWDNILKLTTLTSLPSDKWLRPVEATPYISSLLASWLNLGQPNYSWFLFLKLEYNCFPVLLVSGIRPSESAVCIHILPPVLSPFHPPRFAPLGHHRAPSWAPWGIRQLPASYFTHDSVYICLCYSLSSSHSFLISKETLSF